MAGRKDPEVARVAALRYWRAAEARIVVEAWRRSGEAVTAFARRYGLRARRLSRWARAIERSSLYNLLRTAALHDVPPLAYLTTVLTKLAAGWPPERLEELLLT